MSDKRIPSRHRRTGDRRDAGLSLIELLVSVMLLGTIATVISASVVVTLKTSRATDGRLNVARAEQNVATWLPADLSSAVDASDVPGDTACGVPTCPGVSGNPGSNALLLTWPSESGTGTTTVSYVYRRESSGEKFELIRVKCVSTTSCTSNIVLRDLDGPEVFDPGVTPVPDDVISVTVPLLASATEATSSNFDTGSTARRIVVTINGGGEVEGAGGGVNRVSITAGGTSLGTLEPAKVTGPSFTEARSRCGGPISIIVDDSGSIGSDVSTVENAVRGFVQALAGTPTSVQIVPFSKTASVIGGGSAWSKYYDMTVQTEVDALVGGTTSGGLIRSTLVANEGTNWEDAIFRTFYAPNGDRLDDDGDPSTYLPNLVVFFTDGEPTYSRYDGRGGGAAITGASRVNYTKAWPGPASGYRFDQEGYNRAEELLKPFRNTDAVKVVGVGVGGISTGQVYSFPASKPLEYSNGLTFGSLSSSNYKRVYEAKSNGDPKGSAFPYNTATEKVLGNFIAGGALWIAGDKPYVKSTYSTSTSTWSNPETADMFITNDFDKLPSALSTIALGQCGGTLTLQTSLGGSPAPKDVTYESDGKTVTTSLVNRAAAFDVTTPDGAPVTTLVKPQSFADSGYVAQSWSCRSKGAVVPAGTGVWSYAVAGDASAGIDVTVAANQAVSCTLAVATS